MFLRNSPISAKTLEQIYNTKHCSALQCDSTNSFEMNLFGDKVRMNICALISFRKKLLDINIETLLLSADSPSIEVINLDCIDKLFVFTIEEILELRDLTEGTFAMLQLNSIIHQNIHRNILV